MRRLCAARQLRWILPIGDEATHSAHKAVGIVVSRFTRAADLVAAWSELASKSCDKAHLYGRGVGYLSFAKPLEMRIESTADFAVLTEPPLGHLMSRPNMIREMPPCASPQHRAAARRAGRLMGGIWIRCRAA